MLNNFRNMLAPTLSKIGRIAAAAGLSPTAWTMMGIVCAVIAAFLFGLNTEHALVLGGIVLLVSGFFDIIDGQVARITNKESKMGSFIDSVADKISEVLIFIGILAGNHAMAHFVIIVISLSLLVSYTRSKAESLGVSLQGVGIGERAERLLIIAIAAIIGGITQLDYVMEYGIIIVCIIAGLTLVQRIFKVSKELSN